MTKVGLVMRKIQYAEAQGPRVFADRLTAIARELGVEIVPIMPERHVSAYDHLPGYEYEKGDLVNYDIVLDQLEREQIDHVIYTVSGFTFLKMFIAHSVLFPHSIPHPDLTGYEMMKPFYGMVDKAIVQTDYIKQALTESFGVSDIDVIPIGFNEQLANHHYKPNDVKANRILWIGRDEPNRRPDLVFSYAKANPDKDVVMVFGGERYRASLKRYQIPNNVTLHFALTQDEIFQLMNTAKVFWSSSTFDTYAMPLTEAMAMGKIIVKPEHPCYRHIASQHVFSGNEMNWSELVNMASAQERTVSSVNREYAFAHFSSSVMKQGYQSFFDGWLR